MPLPEKLFNNTRWTEHYHFWLDFFNHSNDIISDILKLYNEVDDSTLETYYVTLNPSIGVSLTNPLSFALATCNKLDLILAEVTKNQDFYYQFYNMIFTVFHDSGLFFIRNNHDLIIHSSLFDSYKEIIDWFGVFHTLYNNKVDLKEYEKILYQTYYPYIFKLNAERPDDVGGFWRAIMLGVQIPIDFIYQSLLEVSTSFAKDEHNLFYRPIQRYWSKKELDQFLKNPITPDAQKNVISFMDKMDENVELAALISFR